MRIIISISFFFLVCFFYSCNNLSQRAADYNNTIINEQRKLTILLDSLHTALAETNTSSIDKFYNKAVLQAGIALETLQKSNSFNDDSSLKEAGIQLFSAYKNLLANDFLIIIKEFKPPLYYFSERKETALQKKMEEIDTKLTLAIAEFQKVQKDFSRKYNFELQL